MLAFRRSLAAWFGAGFLAAAGVVVVPGPAAVAAPPECPDSTTQTHTRNAQAVFSGTVTDVERESAGGRVGYTHTVEVARVWKGGISTGTVEVTTRGGRRSACGLGRLPEGDEVMFFVARDGGSWSASGTSGTALATERLVTQVTRLLGRGRSPVPPAPETAEFTRVADGSPPSLGRTAAPGVALVIVGLLGLLVVRRAGRP